MNRVTEYEAKIADKLSSLDEAKLSRLDASMAVDFADHAAYQNAQSRAFAAGRLTFDEAQVVYHALGEGHSETNGGWTAETCLARKVTITQMVGELIGAV